MLFNRKFDLIINVRRKLRTNWQYICFKAKL